MRLDPSTSSHSGKARTIVKPQAFADPTRNMTATLKVLAAAAVVALSLFGCSIPSPVPSGPATQQVMLQGGPTNTKAADLRTRLNLLLGEHVMIVAKQAAAAAHSTGEYTAYVSLLDVNASDLQNLMAEALGNTAATQLAALWQRQNADLVEYTVGLVTHRASQANAALADLQGFAGAFSEAITSLTRLKADAVGGLIRGRLSALQAVIQDTAGQSYAQLYADLLAAYAQGMPLGDALAGRLASMFPDKFPGDLGPAAVKQRVDLDLLLQEHSYLGSMTTDAAAHGRPAEQGAASRALTTNATALAALLAHLYGAGAGHGQTSFAQAWASRDAALLGYITEVTTGAGRVALTQTLVGGLEAVLPIPAGLLTDQADAAISVVDDQKAGLDSHLAADDRTAAAAMQPIGDQLAAGASAQG